jgi:large subunit ribosomal protein L31
MPNEKKQKPKMHQVEIHCSCGNIFKTLSTSDKRLRVEICSNCHPLYTGAQKLVDTTGQLEKFKARLEKIKKYKISKKKK